MTKTLLIAGEAQATTAGHRARRAACAPTTRRPAKTPARLMPAQQSGSPMTYMLNGKQYIVVAIGGGNYPGELLAFRLPS